MRAAVPQIERNLRDDDRILFPEELNEEKKKQIISNNVWNLVGLFIGITSIVSISQNV